jgi:hypothetical protein
LICCGGAGKDESIKFLFSHQRALEGVMGEEKIGEESKFREFYKFSDDLKLSFHCGKEYEGERQFSWKSWEINFARKTALYRGLGGIK